MDIEEIMVLINKRKEAKIKNSQAFTSECAALLYAQYRELSKSHKVKLSER